MKIYTKTGDKGETGLWGGARVPKDHPRVAAYGDVDELNSNIGAAIAALDHKSFSGLRQSLAKIQAELFTVGALLASPDNRTAKLPQLAADAPTRLEKEIDALTAELTPMTHFILPGGCQAGAWLHLARTVCRRAERAVVALGTKEKIPDAILIYLNRLSDYLFTAARWVNSKEGKAETPWQGLAKK